VYAVTAPGAWHSVYSGAGAFATDGAHLYVTATVSGHPAVLRMNPDGSDVTELTAGVFGMYEQPAELAVDDTRVYFHISDEGRIVSVCK
jgi:Tol biopolymer transport system component